MVECCTVVLLWRDWFGVDLPVVGLPRHVQAAHVDRQGIAQPIEQPHEDVHAQLPLDFDDLQVQGLEIPRSTCG